MSNNENERTYYVICEDNCRFEGMTKEQIYDAIAEATGVTPTPVDEAFITKIKEQNANHNLKVWKGTEAQYNAIQNKDADTLYFIATNAIRPVDMDAIMDAVDEEVETKYAEMKAATVLTLDADNWTEQTGFYYQDVEVERINDSLTEWVTCNSDGTGFPETLDYFYLMGATKVGQNGIVFAAYEEPTSDIYVKVRGVE